MRNHTPSYKENTNSSTGEFFQTFKEEIKPSSHNSLRGQKAEHVF
jgi:hypothetical protein